MEVSGQLHALTALPREGVPGFHSIEGWVGPRAGPDVAVKRRIQPLSGIASRNERGMSKTKLNAVVYPPSVSFTRFIPFFLYLFVYFLKLAACIPCSSVPQIVIREPLLVIVRRRFQEKNQ
jgi:hypothetical protein